MVMINKEEYELLKSLEDKWKWIARDKYLKGSPFYGELWIYEYEPGRARDHWMDEREGSKNIPNDDLFHFIQWEDIEPYSIDYLVLEYESENLPQPPVKEQTEKVEVPQFVFDWIEGNKQFEEKWNDYSKEDAMNDTIHFTIYGLFADYPATNSHVELRKPVLKWLSVDRGNYFKLVNAVQYGYEVEEEPLYRARLKVITDEFIASYLRTQSSDVGDRLKALEIGSKYIHEDYRHLSEFTEDELKRLNVWGSNQWEVEEVEENGKD